MLQPATLHAHGCHERSGERVQGACAPHGHREAKKHTQRQSDRHEQGLERHEARQQTGREEERRRSRWTRRRAKMPRARERPPRVGGKKGTRARHAPSHSRGGPRIRTRAHAQAEPPKLRTQLLGLRIDRGKSAHGQIATWLEARYGLCGDDAPPSAPLTSRRVPSAEGRGRDDAQRRHRGQVRGGARQAGTTVYDRAGAWVRGARRRRHGRRQGRTGVPDPREHRSRQAVASAACWRPCGPSGRMRPQRRSLRTGRLPSGSRPAVPRSRTLFPETKSTSARPARCADPATRAQHPRVRAPTHGTAG